MSRFEELPKAYDASSVEDDIYAAWEASGVFDPDKLPERNQKGAPYCIVMPPPNRTGTLHMGHAAMLAIEDVMIRFERMRGKKTLWIPGTDHAAIATQVKVEQLLMKEGMKDPRKELGREKFLERVMQFADDSANTIRKQVRKMGSSCDWTREKYTLDEERSRAVNEMFKRMYDDKIIERGYRVVNWDPQFQTTLSDDEVLTKETTAKLLTFTYDKDFPITISTTRPETKFGDTAVAVHPTDKRYKDLVGKTLTANFCGKQIKVKIIADEAVDPEFGTGALGVTPAHSMIDADIAVRHDLPTVQVIGKDGKMTGDAGPAFSGLTVIEARQKVEKMLGDAGLLKSVVEIPQNLPVAERGGAPVEQLPMRQWFIRVNKKFALRQDTLGRWKKGDEATLKELMTYAVESGQINIVPDQFKKTYFHWINNLRDWCISRQIWFGHQIPVWYKKKVAESHPSLRREGTGEGRNEATGEDLQTEMMVSDTSLGEGWERDPDTLDTWFSSGLWTFSTLGWPDKKAFDSMKEFHPTAVLETGYDILFFWVARMILMSTYALGEVPFKDIYLHGLVRDEQGRKMSKSLGNVLDPLDLIPKYGTDAVRLSLLMGTTPGQDMKLSEAKVEGFRNFTNKLWNISRFILLQIGGDGVGAHGCAPIEINNIKSKTLADEWILASLDETVASVTQKIEKYEFSSAGEELRDFTWSDLADWYLEIAKIEKGKEQILSHILESILKLWHPFMPFVTEHIWKTAGFENNLIISEWPNQSEGFDKLSLEKLTLIKKFEIFIALITDMRRLRAEQGIEPVKFVEFSITSDEEIKNLINSNLEVIKQLARASDIRCELTPDGWVTAMSGTATIGLNVAGAVDIEKEKAKMQKELAELEPYIKSTKAKLKNKEFASKAPAKVIEGMKAKLEEAEGKKKAIEERLGKM
ncbi:MAG: valine--tRNA ligase [Patescibacteria group bacterium]